MNNNRFYIVSGTSGSGKTIALQVLEDLGYYCIDNMPLSLVGDFAEKAISNGKLNQPCAISVDSRNQDAFNNIETNVNELSYRGVDVRVLFLDADNDSLLKRYSETRRKHPLTDETTSLKEAIERERTLLKPLVALANRHIDTSTTTPHELRALIREDCGSNESHACTVLVQSFGFKFGNPNDVDFIFDVRCLPNPHWHANLKNLSGKDQAVIDFLRAEPICTQMITDILAFLDTWIPKFVDDNRSYITVGIGCTGGQHRSVFIVEEIAQQLNEHQTVKTLVRHRELGLENTRRNEN